jgi:hypothetical protein
VSFQQLRRDWQPKSKENASFSIKDFLCKSSGDFWQEAEDED